MLVLLSIHSPSPGHHMVRAAMIGQLEVEDVLAECQTDCRDVVLVVFYPVGSSGYSLSCRGVRSVNLGQQPQGLGPHLQFAGDRFVGLRRRLIERGWKVFPDYVQQRFVLHARRQGENGILVREDNRKLAEGAFSEIGID